MVDLTHGPIEEEQRALMNIIATMLDELFNPMPLPGLPPKPKQVAFVLLTAKFGEVSSGRVNYISNGSRPEIVSMMKELIARFEGRYSEPEQGEPS